MTGIGFAGVGWLGQALLTEIGAMPELRPVAVQDANLDRAHDVARQFGVPWSGERFEELLEAPGVDAIVICTPNALHADQAQQALRARKHVLVQKPLALTKFAAQATMDAARSSGKLLFVDYSYRFLETIDVLRRTIDRPVRALRATFHNTYGPGADKAWFFDPALSGGGALIDLGVHLLDLGLWLLEPRSAVLHSSELIGADTVESAARMCIRLDDVPFYIEVSWSAPRPLTEISFEVTSDDGRLVRWENVDGSFFRFRTVCNGALLLERETTLRSDTLSAFGAALRSNRPLPIDVRIYDLLDRAYGRWTGTQV